MSHKILILGAGKSSGALIDRLCEQASSLDIELRVGDVQEEWALEKTKGRPHSSVFSFDVQKPDGLADEISSAEVVVSMLPAAFHPLIARQCLQYKTHLITPSYVSPAMQALDQEARKSGLLFLNEMGLDPGIDHMSTMELLDRLRAEGAAITGFSSHCGGLVAPACDTNLWHYKFSWNPRNVILAGQGEGMIQFLENKAVVQLPYSELFSRTTLYDLPGIGKLESYPNRDSLKYRDIYGLQQADSLYRGTFRVSPFCEGWQLLVRLGYTTDQEIGHFDQPFSYWDVLICLASTISRDRLREPHDLYVLLGIQHRTDLQAMLEEIGLFADEKIFAPGIVNPARHLQRLLEEKWALDSQDRDWVVMLHDVSYRLGEQHQRIQSVFSMEGKDARHTAMSATVGWPLAVAVEMLLRKQIPLTGVQLPVKPDIYRPVLRELKTMGVEFKETLLNPA